MPIPRVNAKDSRRRPDRRPPARVWLGLIWLILLPGASEAMEGGAHARKNDPLALATVALVGAGRDSGHVSLTYCSGVLIGADRVLTADHCLVQSDSERMVIFYNGASPSTHVPISDVVSTHHLSIDSSVPPRDLESAIKVLGSDTAIVKLAQPVANRPSMPLAARGAPVPRSFRLAGVGLSERSAGTMRTATLKTLAAAESGVVIARAIGARVCLGDSGGPAMTTNERGEMVVWGIATAILSPQGRCGSIVIVTPISSY